MKITDGGGDPIYQLVHLEFTYFFIQFGILFQN
jgi:hypothetical protein